MAISTRAVAYRHLDAALNGLLVWDESIEDPRPGILLVHGGGGLDDHARTQARRYAALGYVVLAADMFGEGIAGDRARIVATLTTLRANPDLTAGRAAAGLEVLSACAEVSDARAAVGFCFGGLTVLTLARAGAVLAGVISMHGSLATAARAEPGAVKAKLLVCHGAADPHVPLSDVAGFADEMDRAGADWQLIMYGGAVHGFTHDHAVPGATPGVAYDADADRRSFAAARSFLGELSAGSPAGREAAHLSGDADPLT